MDNNEDKLKSEFLEFYETFKKYKSQQEQQPILLFDVNAFTQGMTYRDKTSSSKKYSKKDIRRYLTNPEQFERQLREASIYLYNTCQEYKNLIYFMSRMLTHDYILFPDRIIIEDDNKILNSFYKNLEFIENYNIKSKLSDIEAQSS